MGNEHLGEPIDENDGLGFVADGEVWTNITQNEILLNAPSEVVRANIMANIKACSRRVAFEEPHGRKAIICGAGPSLAKSIDEIHAREGDIFGLSNVPSYLRQFGLVSRYQVVLDANPHTLDFGYADATEQMIASQVDPRVLLMCANPCIWHADSPETQDIGGCIIGGGLSVGLHSLCLAYTLGYRELHLYGYDSSHAESKHVYRQALNDQEGVIEVIAGGRKFTTSVALAHQAYGFQHVAASLACLGCDIYVHGEGLLPHLAWVFSQAARSQQETLQ